MSHKGILILDFGSQFTQLIARRIREMNVYCEIHPCTEPFHEDWTYDGIKMIVVVAGPVRLPCSATALSLNCVDVQF